MPEPPDGVSSLQLRRHVAVTASAASSLIEALSQCLGDLCARGRWAIGHAYLVVDGNEPITVASSHVWYPSDDARFSAFREKSESLHAGQDVGISATAVRWGSAVWLAEVGEEAGAGRAEVATSLGIRSAAAFPVARPGFMPAVIEFFAVDRVPFDPEFADVMAEVSVLLAHVAERERLAIGARRDEDRFRKCVEHAADAIFVYGMDGRFTHVNLAACEMLAFSRDELVRMYPWDVVISQSREFMERTWTHMATGTPLTVDCVLRRKDGSTLVATARIVKFETGGEELLITVCHDVTVDRAREENLRQEVQQRRRAEELARAQTASLTQTLNALAAEHSLESFLGHVLRAIAQQLGAKAASIWLVDSTGVALKPVMHCENGNVVAAAESPAMRYSYELAPTLAPLMTNRLPVVKDVATDMTIAAGMREYLLREGVSTILTVPLLLNDRFLGVMTARRTGGEQFTDEHIQLSQALATQASLAIELTTLAERARGAAIVEERTRLARDIHDTLGQAFTAVLVQIEAARLSVGEPAADLHLARAADAARQGLAEARRSVWAVRADLEQTPVSDAIRAATERLTRHSDHHVSYDVKGASYSIDPVVKEVLLRVLQESLTNVMRHAHSRAIEVSLDVTEDYVELHVADDGRGFDSGEDGFGFGLNSMRQRLEHVGGSLTVESEVDRGTRVRAHIPRRG